MEESSRAEFGLATMPFNVLEDSSRAEFGLATMPFNVLEDVRIKLTTVWQKQGRSSSESESSAIDRDGRDGRPFRFTIDGPYEVVAFLEHIRKMQGVSTVGFLSPPKRVTISGKRAREAAGIPLDCEFFAFAYPLECLRGMYDELLTDEGRDEPWLSFVLPGHDPNPRPF